MTKNIRKTRILGDGREPIKRIPRALRDDRLIDIAYRLDNSEPLPPWAVDYLVGGLLRVVFDHEPWPADELKWRKVGFRNGVPLLKFRLTLLKLFSGEITRREAVKTLQDYGVSQRTAYRLTRLPGAPALGNSC